jgi:ABC-2 type transport system permease protein
VLGWSTGLFLMGLAYGSIGDDVRTLIGDSAASQDVFVQGGGDVVDGFYAVAIVTLALIGSGFTVSSALRPRSEEEAGRVETLLATGLSRRRWLVAHVVTTVVGTALVMAGGGLGLGVGCAMVTADTGRIGPFLLGSLGYAAPCLVIGALGRLLYGAVPRWAGLAWLGLALGVVAVFFGPLLRLPAWVVDLSPYHQLALVPAEPFRWGPLWVLLALAGVLSCAGQVAFTRRDIG